MLKYQLQQAEFAAFIRNPDNNTVSDSSLEARRLKVYSDLFFNNIEGFLASSFPVLKTLMTEPQWLAMSRDFIEQYRCQSPYFLQISEEFLSYLEDDNRPCYSTCPELAAFIQELAHYEWLELAVEVSEEEFVMDKGQPITEQSLHLKAHVSPVAVAAAYQWPVHKICADFIPSAAEAEPACLLVYRDRQQEVGFMESNAPTLRLLEILQQADCGSVAVAIERLAAEMQQCPEDLYVFAVQLLNQLHALDIISHFD